MSSKIYCVFYSAKQFQIEALLTRQQLIILINLFKMGKYYTTYYIMHKIIKKH